MSVNDEKLDQGQLSHIQNKLSAGLPKSWVLTTLGEPFKWGSGGTPRSGNAQFYGGDIPWLVIGDLSDGVVHDSVTKITELGLKNSSAKLVEAGSILLAMYGSIGKLGIAGKPLATNQAIAFTKTNEIAPLYLFFFLKYVSNRLAGLGKGATQLNISQTVIKAFPFVLAPTNEQHRIVAKIEELFSGLDKGIENLKTARAQLKVYRQALLKHAFEGKLTAQWRAAHQDKLETADALLKRIQQERAQRYQQQLADWEAAGKQSSKPKAPKPLPPLTKEELAELPELPEGWGWVRLASIATVISGYAFKSGDFVSAGVPVVKIANVGYSEFVEKDQEYLNSSFLQTQKDFLVSPNDFLLALTRPITNNRTKVCRYPQGAPIALLNQRVSAMKDVRINPEFLYAYLGTSVFKESVRSKSSETLQPNLSPKDLEACPIPICCFSEQVQIACEIEARLSEVDHLDQTLTTSLQQAEALRQSILKRAFSGQLVPQDPHDEPASKLLARIQTERAGVVAKPRKKSTGYKLSPVEIASPSLSKES